MRRAGAAFVSIVIADTGIGIPRTALAKLGRPFEQVESQLTKSHQGSGLGLPRRTVDGPSHTTCRPGERGEKKEDSQANQGFSWG